MSVGLLLPKASARLECTSTTDQFKPLTPWIPSIHAASLVMLVLAVTNLSANMRVRIGIQTATVDPDQANAPQAVADESTYITSQSRNFISFDPTSTSPDNGGIGSHFWFRLGVLYSSSSAGQNGADVELLPAVR